MPLEGWILAMLMSLSAWLDWRHRRIPNRLLQVFSLIALAISLRPEGLGLPSALSAALLGGLAFMPLYLLGQMGGGDIKLMATTGLLVGIEQMAMLCLTVAICGGVLALGWWWHLRRSTTPLSLARHPPEARRLHARMPYALAVAAGALAHGLLTIRPLWPL